MATAGQGIPIIGTGARTPLGLDASSTAAAARAGVAMMEDHPLWLDKYGEPIVVCRDAELPPEMSGIERLLGMAVPAAREALAPLLGNKSQLPPITALIAVSEERPGRPRDLEKQFGRSFAAALKDTIELEHVDCQPLGHAGGLMCMERALSLIDGGQSQLCLVGGVDSYLERPTLDWLDGLERLHSEATIWGICPGEAAGFCLLAARDLAARLSLRAPVLLRSAASAVEANRIYTDTVCIGEGLSAAFQTAFAALPASGAMVDHTICDMNGEPYRGNEFGFAKLRSSGRFVPGSEFDTPADCWGDVGAASGPLFAVLASFAAAKHYAPGPLTFLWASSDGGARAAALVQAAANGRKEPR